MDQPVRDRRFVTEHFSSERWNDFPWRDGDIVVATGVKTGTTWTLRILGLLVHQDLGRIDETIMHAPWPDANFMPPVEELHREIAAIDHRRFFKSHLPLDCLPYEPRVRYINVTRHPLDTFRSLLHHWGGITDAIFEVFAASGYPDFPRLEEQGSVKQVFARWISEGREPWEQDGWPFHSCIHVAESFWKYRHLPNVLTLHYARLTEDLSREVARIEDFLGMDIPKPMHDEIVRLASFATMKAHNKAMNPHYDVIFKHGGEGFMREGGIGKWRDMLDAEDLALYEARMARLDPAFRSWIEDGASD